MTRESFISKFSPANHQAHHFNFGMLVDQSVEMGEHPSPAPMRNLRGSLDLDKQLEESQETLRAQNELNFFEHNVPDRIDRRISVIKDQASKRV